MARKRKYERGDLETYATYKIRRGEEILSRAKRCNHDSLRSLMLAHGSLTSARSALFLIGASKPGSRTKQLKAAAERVDRRLWDKAESFRKCLVGPNAALDGARKRRRRK